jgi:hypothetical protein
MPKVDYPQEHIDLMARNAARVEEAKQKMGSVWVLHPTNNTVRNKKAPQPILSRK